MMRVLNRHSAAHFSVDISTKRNAASFHFVEPTGDVRVVTVPLLTLGVSIGTLRSAWSPSLNCSRASPKSERNPVAVDFNRCGMTPVDTYCKGRRLTAYPSLERSSAWGSSGNLQG